MSDGPLADIRVIDCSGLIAAPGCARYLADFRQIAALHVRGASLAEIRAATGRSASLINEYIGLYERGRREFPSAPRLADLLDVHNAKKGGRPCR